MNFGQFQTFGQSHELLNMLKNNDLTLEELLKRDNFLNDLKAGAMNEFINFSLRNKDIIEEMIIILTSSNHQNNYPFVISEIFEHSNIIQHLFENRKPKILRLEKKTTLEQYLAASQDTPEIQEEESEISGNSIKFLPDTGDGLSDQDAFYLIQKLFSFLKTSKVDETQMGYFGKALHQIGKNYSVEFWEFTKIYGSVISDLLSHLRFKQIQEFFARVIVMDHPQQKQFRLFEKQRKDLVFGLLQCVVEWEDSIDFLDSVCEFLSYIFQFGSHIYEHVNEILDVIIKPTLYFDVAVKSKVQSVYKLYYSSVCQLGILSTKFQLHGDSSLFSAYFQTELLKKEIILMDSIIPQFGSTIYSNLASPQIDKTKYESYQHLFGFSNLQIVKSIDIIIRFKNQILIDTCFKVKIFDDLLNLTTQYHWNNQLHCVVLQIFLYLIQHNRQQIIQNTSVLNYLHNYIMTAQNNSKLGCIGVLKQIGFQLLQDIEDQVDQSLIIKLRDLQSTQDTLMLNINPKDCKEAPPIELSIDRQIEMMLDEKKDEKHK